MTLKLGLIGYGAIGKHVEAALTRAQKNQVITSAVVTAVSAIRSVPARTLSFARIAS